ncbi:MAG: maltodextrin glucosidase [Ardenticatenaceae bacterium]|nr:maltodextrin glucosidase [Ardenticatenaceae bacterium]
MTQFSLPPWLQTVHHDGSAPYVSELYPRLGDTVRIRLRTGLETPLRRAYIRTAPDGEQVFTALEPGPADPSARWWQTEIAVNQPVVQYRFILEADDGVWFYTAAGPCAHLPLDATDFRILADYEAPEWVKTAVFYQIFPDRFYNGNPATDPHEDEYELMGHRPKTYSWGQPSPGGFASVVSFYGGDLPGITEKLDYLQDLGINTLYLNPIFTSYSNHKYDVTDYEHVDPHLGGDAALITLRQELDKRGMRYMLDIVPNHCGVWHPWFQAACNDPAAPESEFFTFHDHPVDYESWLGHKALPKLNYRSRELRRRIYNGHDSVFRRWLRPPFAADGWRVDVANMLGRQGEIQVGHKVARGIRRAVKETRRDAYLMAESFFDSSPQLQGNEWDGMMNYAGFTLPLWHWLRGFDQGAIGIGWHVKSDGPWPTAALAASWQQHLAAVPWAVALQQYNLLDSHDVPRIRTTVGGHDALHRLAAVVQFAFPGLPGVYYGDEIGMADEEGFRSRGCMIWDESQWDHDLLAFYRRLIQLRKESSVLQTGGFQILAVEADTLVFQRMGENGRILVAAHRGEKARPARPLPVAHGGIPDGCRFVEYFSGAELVVAKGHLPLPPLVQGAALWQMVGGS